MTVPQARYAPWFVPIGYWLGGEEIHVNTLLGSALILASVVAILTSASEKH